MNKKKILITAVVAAVLILVALVGLSQRTDNSRKGKVPVSVLILPSDAKATANNIPISSGTEYLQAGTYTVQVTKDGFESITTELTITENQNYIQIALSGVSPEAKAWEAKNTELLKDFEREVGVTSRASGEKFFTKFPLAQRLPVSNFVYKIGYKTDGADGMIVTIHAITADQRKAAIQQIRDWGYDPADYKITFTQFSNPLE